MLHNHNVSGVLFAKITPMKKAREADLYQITNLYGEALTHAKNVGHIDWPDPFTLADVAALYATNELYCFGASALDGVARISFHPDVRIWGERNEKAIYLAKVATSNAVRGTRYFERVMLPDIQGTLSPRPPLRLDCVADNPGLKEFYSAIGFNELGDVTFFSEKQNRPVTVSRFEMS